MNEQISEAFVDGFMSKCAEAGLEKEAAGSLLAKALLGIGRRVAPGMTGHAVARQAVRYLPAMRANSQSLQGAISAAQKAVSAEGAAAIGRRRLEALGKYLNRKYPDSTYRALFSKSTPSASKERLLHEIKRDVGVPLSYMKPVEDPIAIYNFLDDAKRYPSIVTKKYDAFSKPGWTYRHGRTVDQGGLASRFGDYVGRADAMSRAGQNARHELDDAARRLLPYTNTARGYQTVDSVLRTLTDPANRSMFLRTGII